MMGIFNLKENWPKSIKIIKKADGSRAWQVLTPRCSVGSERVEFMKDNKGNEISNIGTIKTPSIFNNKEEKYKDKKVNLIEKTD